MHEVASTEVVDRLQPDVLIAEQPMVAREDACVSCGRHYLREARVVGVLGVWLSDQPALEPSGAARLDQRHAEHRPLLRRQPFFLDRSSAGLMQHVCVLIEAKEQPVGKIHLRFGGLVFRVYHYTVHSKNPLCLRIVLPIVESIYLPIEDGGTTYLR